MVKVTITKSAKQFIAALKVVSNLCKSIIFNVSSKRGISFEVITDDRCGYITFLMPPSDHVTITCSETDDLKFNLQLKTFIASMRDVTTLNDVVVLDFSIDKLLVTTKTKKSEQTTDFVKDMNEDETLLQLPGTPPSITYDFITKEFEDILKTFVATPKTKVKMELVDNMLELSSADEQNNVYKLDIKNNVLTYSTQLFRVANLQTIVKSTLAKRVELHLYDNNPLCMSYSLFSKGYMNVFMSPTK